MAQTEDDIKMVPKAVEYGGILGGIKETEKQRNRNSKTKEKIKSVYRVVRHDLTLPNIYYQKKKEGLTEMELTQFVREILNVHNNSILK